jgi:hypothetical protein
MWKNSGAMPSNGKASGIAFAGAICAVARGLYSQRRKSSIRVSESSQRRACPGKPGAGNPHAGFYLEGEVQGQSRPLPTDHRIDHSVLEGILQERFHDNRFLRLMRGLLKAGYLEEWTFNATYSGVPQGGVVSPILSNLVLDRLDKYVETHLIPAYTQGRRRRTNPPYVR